MEENIREKFKRNRLSLLKCTIQLEKSQFYFEETLFQDFIRDYERIIKSQQRDFNSQIEGVIEFETDEDQSNFESFLDEGSEKYFESYPKYLRHSMVITLYSFLEDKLERLLTNIERFKNELIDDSFDFDKTERMT